MSLDPQYEVDRAHAFNYLKRIHITVFSDDHGAWQNLLDIANFLLVGDPEIAIATILSYVENNNRFGSPIHADELRRYLAGKCIHPRQLAHDSRITPAIENLQREFANSIRPQLIGGSPIQRQATDELVKAIQDQRK